MSQERLKKTNKFCPRKLLNIKLKNTSLESTLSPYSKQFSVSNSYSGLKIRSNQISQNSLLLKSLISNTSFGTPMRKSAKLPKEAFVVKKKNFEETLEYKMDQEIRQHPLEKFKIVEKYFSEVIKRDKTFAGLLAKIKSVYDEKIGYFAVQNLEDLNEEVAELRKKVSDLKIEKKEMKEEIESLGKENYKISKTLDKTESLYLEVHEKLQKVYNTEIEDCEKSEINWKRLVLENKKLSKVRDNLKKENKLHSQREKEYINLILELKERGFPVREVYENMGHEETPEESCKSFVESDTENEDLVSGRAIPKEKPSQVPLLNFSFISNDSIDPYYSSNDN